jgi:Tol biopolymer transport system component
MTTRRQHRGPLLITAVVCVGAVILTGPPAPATFHGHDGRIVFYVDRGSGLELDTVRPDGSGLRVLYGTGKEVGAADWSPDGTRLVFSVHRAACDGPMCAIVMVNRDGSGLRTVFAPRRVPAGAQSPRFMPGGRRIVFLYDCPDCNQGIWTINRSGGDRRRVLNVSDAGRGDLYAEGLAVSPDGSHIGFVVQRGSGRGLFVVRRDGTHVHQIVAFRQDVGLRFDWAPDGRHLVYTRHSDSRGGHNANVVRIRPDGTHARLLTHVTKPGVGVGVGTYSPNGHWIVYRHQNDNTGVYRLVKMHPNGSDKTRILRAPSSPGGIVWGPRPE